MDREAWGWTELRAAMAGGLAAPGPFDMPSCLVLDAADAPDQGQTLDDARRFLKSMPCPVLARRRTGHPIEAACDVVPRSAQELAQAERGIAGAPLAALALVQVLRITATLDISAGLGVESFAYATLQDGPEARCRRAQRGTLPAAPEEPGPPILCDRQDGMVQARLNRPGNRNAISMEMRDALVELFELVLADASIERVEIAGDGKCFSVGGDLTEFGRAPSAAEAHAIRTLRLPAAALARCAARVEFRLHGACIGAGVELPSFAGRVVASPTAWFQLPEVSMGLIPGAGGCIGLPRRIGRERTAWLALSGRRIDAATALDWGLVDAIQG